MSTEIPKGHEKTPKHKIKANIGAEALTHTEFNPVETIPQDLSAMETNEIVRLLEERLGLHIVSTLDKIMERDGQEIKSTVRVCNEARCIVDFTNRLDIGNIRISRQRKVMCGETYYETWVIARQKSSYIMNIFGYVKHGGYKEGPYFRVYDIGENGELFDIDDLDPNHEPRNGKAIGDSNGQLLGNKIDFGHTFDEILAGESAYDTRVRKEHSEK